MDSPYVNSADEYVVLKEESDGESGSAIGPYLNVMGLTKVCVERGVDLVHPGKSFLACYMLSVTCWILLQ